jgi:hypothetical protein
MKRLTLALLIAAAAASSQAQTASSQSAPPRGTTPTNVTPAITIPAGETPFVVRTERPDASKVMVKIGSLTVNRRDLRTRVAWLPVLAPFPGSVPSTTSVMPDAFALLGTEFPYRPGMKPRSR